MILFDAVGRGLQEAFFMFWSTLWALVLGFGLSGAVQAFVSRTQMQEALGDHKTATVAKASFFGIISSSCSYAASALAKSLFAKGADFTSAMIFMIASTNLVVELGLVLWILMGWQFALAEFVGGAIMITLLAIVLPRAIPLAWLGQARQELEEGNSLHDIDAGAANLSAATDGSPESWKRRIRSRAGWSDAAGYAVSDLTMLRKEMFAGFIIAGFLATLVPNSLWRSLFLTGHGIGSSLENVVLGPLLALISFVCSVGNVPLAAALWQGGISFGGVIAFVFADLITLPLLLIYRKYYGSRITLRLLAVFWATMSVAGLLTELVFKALSLVPQGHRASIAGRGVRLDYTTVLDLLALVVFAYLYWLYKNRERFGGGAGYAKDVVCAMQVQRSMAPARTAYQGTQFYFCSDGCLDRFQANPQRYLPAPGQGGLGLTLDLGSGTGSAPPLDEAGGTTDPVCGMAVSPTSAAGPEKYAGREYFFCCNGCRQRFGVSPISFLQVARDPVCGMDVEVESAASRTQYEGREYIFCNPGCRDSFEAAPARYLPGSVVGGGGQ